MGSKGIPLACKSKVSSPFLKSEMRKKRNELLIPLLLNLFVKNISVWIIVPHRFKPRFAFRNRADISCALNYVLCFRIVTWKQNAFAEFIVNSNAALYVFNLVKRKIRSSAFSDKPVSPFQFTYTENSTYIHSSLLISSSNIIYCYRKSVKSL